MPEKKKFSDNVKCGHCQNVAPMEIAGSHSESEELYARDGGLPMGVEGTTVQLLICPSCRKPNVRTREWGSCVDPSLDVAWTILYPEPRSVPLGMPKKVASAYEAAAKIKHADDANAFAVMLGRVLDRVCQDKGAAGEALFDRLNDLAAKGVISTTLGEMAQRLRDLRNMGGHADLGDLTPQEIPILDDLCRAILEYVYSGPKLIARVRHRLDELNNQGG